MIKAVLFDMNGIIIDAEHIHELAFQKTVKSFGISLDHQVYLDCCSGKIDIGVTTTHTKEDFSGISSSTIRSLALHET